MKASLTGQRTADKKYGVRYAENFSITLPAEQIDMYKWITEMTESDYRSYSRAHLAMNSYFKNGKLFMINVENVGADMIVQHYELKDHSAEHIRLYSARSEAYVMRWFPAIVGVPWEMQIRPVTKETCELVCLIGADYPNLFLKAAAWLNGLGGTFLKRHLRKEGKAFAKDIEEKFRLTPENYIN
ncbi:MAG: hypothetical protein WDN26_21330 [Chitinophagaceae bacterium]